MTRASVWTNSDGLKVGFGANYPDYSNVGQINTDGLDRELRFTVDGERFTAGVYQLDTTDLLPIGAVPLAAHVRVTEVFALGGTTPTIQFGSTTSSGGVPAAPAIASAAAAIFGSVSEANAEALGTYTLSVTATPLTATTAGNIQITLGGTTPTVTAAGKMVVTLVYRQAA